MVLSIRLCEAAGKPIVRRNNIQRFPRLLQYSVGHKIGRHIGADVENRIQEISDWFASRVHRIPEVLRLLRPHFRSSIFVHDARASSNRDQKRSYVESPGISRKQDPMRGVSSGTSGNAVRRAMMK